MCIRFFASDVRYYLKDLKSSNKMQWSRQWIMPSDFTIGISFENPEEFGCPLLFRQESCLKSLKSTVWTLYLYFFCKKRRILQESRSEFLSEKKMASATLQSSDALWMIWLYYGGIDEKEGREIYHGYHGCSCHS